MNVSMLSGTSMRDARNHDKAASSDVRAPIPETIISNFDTLPMLRPAFARVYLVPDSARGLHGGFGLATSRI